MDDRYKRFDGMKRVKELKRVSLPGPLHVTQRCMIYYFTRILFCSASEFCPDI